MEWGRPHPRWGKQLSHRACDHAVCITCSDQALTGRVLELREDGTATVDTGDGIVEASLALVDAAVNDIVLLHAGVAIGKQSPTP